MTRRILTCAALVALLSAGCEPSGEEKLFREMGPEGYCTMRVHDAVQASLSTDDVGDSLVAENLFSEAQLIDLLGPPDATLPWAEWVDATESDKGLLGEETYVGRPRPPDALFEWDGESLVVGSGCRHVFAEPLIGDARILLYRWDEPVENTGSIVGGTIFVTAKNITFRRSYFFGVAESKVIHAGIIEWTDGRR